MVELLRSGVIGESVSDSGEGSLRLCEVSSRLKEFGGK